MATFTVNGVEAKTTEGEAIVVTNEKSFVFGWSDLDRPVNVTRVWMTMHLDTFEDLTVGSGSASSVVLWAHGDPSGWPDEYDWRVYEGVGWAGTYPVAASSSLSGKTLEIGYLIDSSSLATYYVTFQAPLPTITKSPSISSISPASGLSTTVQWTAATAQDLGSATIKYQYFVGPSSTFNTSYLVGTTTGQTANITEADIQAKCGSSFSGTCHIYVRAYWDNGETQGGHTTPHRGTFTYSPHDTIKYYTGSRWAECIVYYYNGERWVECIPYYYIDNEWNRCSF